MFLNFIFFIIKGQKRIFYDFKTLKLLPIAYYQAIIKHANLSKNERENIALLLSNFVLSALVTNLLLLPFLIMINFLKNRKRV